MASVVGYIRISKEEEGSTSLATQRGAIESWCKMMGHELVDVYGDEGVSGGIAPLERPGTQKAIQHARKKGIDILLVSKLDRISRDLGDTLNLVDNVLKGRATLVSISESFDASTPSGRMFLQLLGTFAEFERNKIRERTRDALATRRKQGRHTGGAAPFGYRIGAEKRLVPIRKEQSILDRAFELRFEGRSWRETADALNAEGLFRRDKKPWTPSRACDVLTAETRRRFERTGNP